jgi:hypothetical protein
MELVFPRFPTLLLLIKKRAAPDAHGLAISVIYYTDSISSMCIVRTVIYRTLVCDIYGYGTKLTELISELGLSPCV